MDYGIQDWHWLVFGMLLMIAEIFVATFFIFWFGLGALVVAAVLWFAPALGFGTQLLLWAVFSSMFALLWFRYFRPLMIDRTKAGISREAIVGETGQVIRIPAGKTRGVVRFATPLLGSEEWPFLCEQAVEAGDRVVVMDISGNTLVVEKR
ncbi:MAG: NfeD family protein [Gammaproteobacteria bacterium]|nr:NfeD family protein [Gammaproteobacteria bacterium]